MAGLSSKNCAAADFTRPFFFSRLATACLIAFVSSAMTLLPGDVILTGTPAGVGPIVDGDSVTIDIEGIGALTNPVRTK